MGKTRHAVLSMIFIALLVLSIVPINIVSASTPNEVRITQSFSVKDFTFTKQNNYDLVNLKDGDYLIKAKSPMLPAKEISIALPKGMKATGVRVENVKSTVLTSLYNLYPGQVPITISSGGGKFTEPDKTAYSSSALYPLMLAELKGQSDLAGQGIAVVNIYPMQYSASQKKLTLTTSMTIVVEGTDSYVYGDYLPGKFTSEQVNNVRNEIKSSVVNPEAVSLNGRDTPITTLLEPGTFEYVIITPSAYASNFQSFADWKTKKGVPAKIVTTEWIYNDGGYSGTNPEKIRSFVIDANQNWGTIYILIGGDTNLVPPHISNVGLDPYTIPEDTFYADFDSDWVNEVNVGRAPVTNIAEINNFVNKTMYYERNPALTNFSKNAAMMGFDLDASTPAEVAKQYIDNTYIPADWNMFNVYDSQTDNHKVRAIGAMNSGQNLINHADHANYYIMGVGDRNHGWDLLNSDMSNLNNANKQGVMYSLGCWPNAIDYASIGEAFVKNTHGGGVSFIGNTRYGWYYEGNTNLLAFTFDKNFFKSIFQEGRYLLGDAFSDHKNDKYPTDEYYQYEWLEINLLGDPQLPLWTDNPKTMNVGHPAEVIVGNNDFTVHVTNNLGTPLNHSLVTLWKGNEVYLRGYTNVQGDVTLSPSPQTEGQMYVTVTLHNYLTYEGTANVIAAGPFVLSGDVTHQNGDPATELEVQVINLNTGQKWNAQVEGNHYSLELVAGSDVQELHVLRFISKADQDMAHVADVPVFGQDIAAGGMTKDFILDTHYRDLKSFPFYLAQFDTGASVAQMMLNYLMWDSNQYPEPPMAYPDQQALFNLFNTEGGLFLNGNELTSGLNRMIDDPGHGWIYGYFFSPSTSTNVSDALKSITVWVDYPVDYYNDIRDVDVPLAGHPNHVPVAVPTYGNYNNWMVVRGIHTNMDAWPPQDLSGLEVYGFWLNDPKVGGMGSNTYITAQRFVGIYYRPINLLGDPYMGKYLSVTDPPRGIDVAIGTAAITVVKSPEKISQSDAAIVSKAFTQKASLTIKEEANKLIIDAAKRAASDVLNYDSKYSESFRNSIVNGRPSCDKETCIVAFKGEQETFNVMIAKSDGSLQEIRIA